MAPEGEKAFIAQKRGKKGGRHGSRDRKGQACRQGQKGGRHGSRGRRPRVHILNHRHEAERMMGTK